MSYASDNMIEQIYNKISDEEWQEYYNREEAALPQTLADVADPYTVGRMEAEQGLPCEPLTHYARLGDIEQYIIGHKDATATLDAAAQHFGMMLGAMVGDADMARMDAYARGGNEYRSNTFAPPRYDNPNYDDYLRGYNDAWAAANGRNILR